MTKVLWLNASLMMGCINNSIPLEDTARADDAQSQSDLDRFDTGGADTPFAVPDSEGINGALVDSIESVETGENSGHCDGDELTIVAEMRDDEGTVVTMGHPTQHHRLWVRIINACDEALDMRTSQSCLITGWTVTSGSLRGSATLPCFGGPTVRTIQPGQWIEREVTPLHDLVEGTYTVGVELGSTLQNEWTQDRAEVEFTVISRAAP